MRCRPIVPSYRQLTATAVSRMVDSISAAELRAAMDPDYNGVIIEGVSCGNFMKSAPFRGMIAYKPERDLYGPSYPSPLWVIIFLLLDSALDSQVYS